MGLKLIIGNKNYSSWSLRPWIAMKVAGIAFDETVIPLDAADFKAQLLADPEVAKHLSRAELDRLCHLDFHLRQVKARFKKLGL